MSVDGGAGARIDRHRVSVQWFSGTILTGLCGAALMGGAVFASLDGETHFAAVPERVEAALRGAITGVGERVATHKGDRLPPASETSLAHQVIRVSTTSRVGAREVVRVRPFVRVSANLALATSELSANIPAFNPQRLLTESASSATPADDAGVQPDAEVSFVTRDLAAVLPKVKLATVLPVEDVVARVREAANWSGGASPHPATTAGIGPGGKLAYANEGVPDPYAGFETRIVPENFTLLPKTSPQASGNSSNERTISVKKGDSVASILRDLGATDDEITAIDGVLGPRGREKGLKEGEKLRVLLSPTADHRLQPVRVIIVNDTTPEAIVALSDAGKYVPVDIDSAETQVADTGEESDDGTGVRLYQSIYETALRNHVPQPVIDKLIRIYSFDVDFQHKTQPGDAMEVVYSGDDEDQNSDAKREVLFTELTLGGETKKFYRFQEPDDGAVDYYDETGKSAKKFLVRKPVASAHISSGFGMRRHPVLGYLKMHTGVDWAAPTGTPVFASGDGVIEKAGWESGYGKYIRIRHTNGYETAYAHMTAFARNMKPGVRVRQGQVIGYVGSTGLTTGSHVHYEIIVNGRFVDPMRVKLPRGRVLEGPVLAAFKKERDRIDNMLTPGASRVAQGLGPVLDAAR